MSMRDMPVIRTQTWWMCRSNRVAWLAAGILIGYAVLVAPFVGWLGLLALAPFLVGLLVGAGRPRLTLNAREVVVVNVFRTLRVPLSRLGPVDTAAGGVCVRTLDGVTVTGFALRHANLLGRHSIEAKWTDCATALRFAAYQASQPGQPYQ